MSDHPTVMRPPQRNKALETPRMDAAMASLGFPANTTVVTCPPRTAPLLPGYVEASCHACGDAVQRHGSTVAIESSCTSCGPCLAKAINLSSRVGVA